MNQENMTPSDPNSLQNISSPSQKPSIPSVPQEPNIPPVSQEQSMPQETAVPKKSNMLLYIIIAIALIAGGIYLYFYLTNPSRNIETATGINSNSELPSGQVQINP